MKPSPTTSARGTDVGRAEAKPLVVTRPRTPRLALVTIPVGPTRYPGVSQCIETGPPGACAHAECRYHLAHRGYWEHHLVPTRDCALDVANEGARTLDEVAAVLGVSGERVRQIEERAIAQLVNNVVLKRLHDELEE